MKRTARQALLALLVFAGCQPGPRAAAEDVEDLVVEVLAEVPHDRGAFCQGLVWQDGVLYESTGLYGRSTLRRVDPATGKVLARQDLDPGLFGEGLALADGRFVQLTWQAGLALVYDEKDLVQIDQRSYGGEGWGLAWDGRRFVMSDGSSRLTFRDPSTFEDMGHVDVTLDGRPVARLNELEVAEGLVYSNVWQEDWIARIDPKTGRVTARIDASGLNTRVDRRGTDVLNCIAYDPDSKSFWITGKLWPLMFRVVFAAGPKRSEG